MGCCASDVMPSLQHEAPEPPFVPRYTASTFPNPLSLASSAWTGASEGAAASAERALLDRYVSSPFKLGRVAIDLPQLGLGKQYVNTLDVNADVMPSSPHDKVPVPIVLTHGAGSGMGFFFRNIEPLSTGLGTTRRLLVFDWLGAAGSSRPSYPYGAFSKPPAWMMSEAEKIDAALAFSVESLEAWRQAMGLERFDLIAHSMGGYLATMYALAYPGHVRRLVLLSPVGWAARPEDEPKSARVRGFFGALWDAGLGNFGAARYLGRLVRGTASDVVVGRLHLSNPEEQQLVSNYFWQSLTSGPISHERNINWLLTPYIPGLGSPPPFGFFAKRPVCTQPADRLATLPPTTLLYGDRDLHYIESMPEAVKRVQATHPTRPVRMHFVSRADHHLYVDNPTEVHRQVLKALGTGLEDA